MSVCPICLAELPPSGICAVESEYSIAAHYAVDLCYDYEEDPE